MDEQYGQRLHQLQLYCRHRVDHHLAGLYRSVFRGQGIEFDEVRAYVPGDDVRAIDWNITARTGEVYIKQFHEERQMNLIFVVDNSPSFAWSSQHDGRQEEAARFCGLLGTVALNNHDRIGLLKFSDGIDQYLPPANGQVQLMRCLSALLLEPLPVTTTSINEALERLNRLKLKRSMVVILSDFFFDGFMESLAILNRHHDVLALAIDDPREQVLSGGGLMQLRDAETGQRQWLDLSSKRVRQDFREQVHRRMEQRSREFSHWGVDLLCHTLGDDPVETLLSFFLARKHRVAGETGG